LSEDILLAACALLNLCFLQGTSYVLSIGGKGEEAMAYSNAMLQNFGSHWTARKVPGHDMQAAVLK